MGDILPRSFYARGAETVAREALGKLLVCRSEGEELLARIVETEAYVGEHDLACHASKGRTRRTEVMFGPPGFAYVYLIYGVYHMLNLVTGRRGVAQAVLVRAAEPVSTVSPEGEDRYPAAAPSRTRGSGRASATPAGGMNGPGKLTRVLGITLEDNGEDLCGGRIHLCAGATPRRIGVGPRIGVDYAGEWADAPLRFYDEESQSVSRSPRKGRS